MKFYICRNCNQVHMKMIDYDLPASCCGTEVEEIIPNNDDSIHAPVIRKIGNFVTVTVTANEKHTSYC